MNKLKKYTVLLDTGMIGNIVSYSLSIGDFVQVNSKVHIDLTMKFRGVVKEIISEE